MFKKTRILILAAVTMAVMLLGSAAVFAADSVPDVNTNGKVTITKNLQTNDGSTVTATFKFTATAVATSSSTVAETPAATISDITLTNATNGATGTGDMTFGTFPHAGMYQYTVKETANTYTANEGETMTYDNSEYTIRVYVKNGTDGLYIDYITAQKGNTKVEKVEFTNTFTEPGGGNSTDPTAGLTIEKTISGGSADLTKEFSMTVKFTDPTYGTQPAITYSSNVTKNNDGSYTFKLSNGQKATFDGMLAGTKYEIVETQASDYQATAVIVANGQSISTQTPAVGANYSQSNILIGEKENTATITNTMEDISPTGIIAHYLPYIAVILLAIVAFALFIVSRRRKAARY